MPAAALAAQVTAQYGAGATIASYEQTSELKMELAGASIADYDNSTAMGRAKRYMLRMGAAGPAGLNASDVVVALEQAAASGRRQLASAPLKMTFILTSSKDVSSSLEGGNFTRNFASSFQAAANNLPASLKARPALPRSWAVLQAPPQTRIRHSAC